MTDQAWIGELPSDTCRHGRNGVPCWRCRHASTIVIAQRRTLLVERYLIRIRRARTLDVVPVEHRYLLTDRQIVNAIAHPLRGHHAAAR